MGCGKGVSEAFSVLPYCDLVASVWLHLALSSLLCLLSMSELSVFFLRGYWLYCPCPGRAQDKTIIYWKLPWLEASGLQGTFIGCFSVYFVLFFFVSSGDPRWLPGCAGEMPFPSYVCKTWEWNIALDRILEREKTKHEGTQNFKL